MMTACSHVTPGSADEGVAGTAGLKRRLVSLARMIGPGIFLVGYIIGTGSVTTLATAGASYGMTLTWALALSCVFTYVMIVSVGRCTIVSGETIIHGIRRHFGRPVAIFIIFGLLLTVISSVIGVTAIASDVFREWTRGFVPGGSGVHPVYSAVVFIGLLYFLFWNGRHRFFLKAMAVVVAVMGVSFVGSMLMVVPSVTDVATGLIPRALNDPNASLVLAGMVGTTMASVCVISRSYLVAEQGWGLGDLKAENRDAILSLTLTFIVSGAIMASAAGTMFPHGIPVRNAIDMVVTLQPLAGPFAASIFVCGIIAAALSSLFAGYLLGPWVVCDYLNTPRKMDRVPVRIAVLLVAATGLIVPVFGGRPVAIMIASQAISPVIMPLLVVLVLVMLNSRKCIGEYRPPALLNAGLVVTLIFTLFMSYAGIVGLIDFVRKL